MSRIALALLLAAAALFAGPAGAAPDDRVVVAQSRPQITVYPRSVEPGPNAKRYCESWLATEYRPSGTVITPRMRCFWR
jgi:hypothetical protein